MRRGGESMGAWHRGMGYGERVGVRGSRGEWGVGCGVWVGVYVCGWGVGHACGGGVGHACRTPGVGCRVQGAGVECRVQDSRSWGLRKAGACVAREVGGGGGGDGGMRA